MQSSVIYLLNESGLPTVAVSRIIPSDHIPDFLSAEEKLDAASIKSITYRSQWIGCRLLLRQVLQGYSGIIYDDKGKPYLANSKMQLSLSHTSDLCAVSIDNKSCGIDIELMGEKVLRIRNRFMNESELEFATDPESMHIVWGVKESIFKSWGKGNLEFRTDMIVKPFEISSEIGEADFRGKQYRFRFKRIDNAMLVYLI